MSLCLEKRESQRLMTDQAREPQKNMDATCYEGLGTFLLSLVLFSN